MTSMRAPTSASGTSPGTAAVTSSSIVFTNSGGGADGSLDAMFGTVTIGAGSLSGNTGTATGLFEFDNGTVSANLIKLGVSISGSTCTGTSTGTFNVKGGSLTAGSIVLGTKGSFTQNAAGVLNLTGGTLSSGTHLIAQGGNGDIMQGRLRSQLGLHGRKRLCVGVSR